MASCALSAIAGAAVAGNLGVLGGSILYEIGMKATEGRSGVEGTAAIVFALAGAVVGAVVATLGLPAQIVSVAKMRAAFTGAAAGCLLLEILGRFLSAFGVPYSPIWALAGGMTGLIGGIAGVSTRLKPVRPLTGVVGGGAALVCEGLFLSQSWGLGVCLLMGASAGGFGELIATTVLTKRRDVGSYVLVAIGVWATLEAFAGNLSLFVSVVVLGVIGMAAGWVAPHLAGSRVPAVER